MPASTYAGNKMLDLLLRGVAFAAPARVFVSLHIADPGVGGANEISLAAWPSYLRQDPAVGGAVDTGFGAAAAKTTNNLKQMNYGPMDGPGDITISHAAVWDAQVAGNMLIYGPLTTPRTFSPTDEAAIRIGKLIESVI
jgi:hypothetical protein